VAAGTETSKKLLGNLLIESGLIDQEQLKKALEIQQRTGERLGRVLVNLGYVTEKDITDMLESQLGICQVTINAEIDPDLLISIPEHIIKRHKVIPLKKEGKRLTVAMADPLNVVAIDDLRLVTGNEIEPVVATEKEIENVIQKYYGMPDLERALQDFEVVEAETVQIDQPEESLANEAPIVRLLNSIIVDAIEEKASDIHIEPYEKEVRVRYRVDGELREAMNLPRRSRAAIISRVKILAELNIAEKRLPQDGRIKIRYQDRDIDLRVSTMPTIFGEKVVIRILDKSSGLLSIDQLGFHPDNLERFNSIINSAYGMVLLTGPTGSGKTTTLYAVLNELNRTEKNIITIEDPVEYILDGINQTQVNVKTGLDFAKGLRSILRQDPDIIMVGEIRDAETARIAIQAATTGHLVFSTLHTTDAAGALTRLIDMGVEPFLVASSVLGVVAQRLVRKICPRCRREYRVLPGTPEHLFIGAGAGEEVKLYKGEGCSYCNQTGYRGRLSIQEILPVSRKVRAEIVKRAHADSIRQTAREEGMVTLKEDGIRKALQGITTVQEVMQATFTAGR